MCDRNDQGQTRQMRTPDASNREPANYIRGAQEITIEERLAELFKHHPPNSSEKINAHESLRAAGLFFAQAILRLVPPGADRSDAIRKVREALMTANAGIANDGMNL